MAISFHCRRIWIQSRSHFINPFPDRATEQAVNEVDWLNSRLFCWEIIPAVDARTAGCVCAPLTFLRSVLACVCTPYRCGCVSTSVCVYTSRFLPYYWLRAAFRLHFQLCWATPSFPVPWSHFYFFSFQERGEERSKTLCPDLGSLFYYRRKRVQTTSQKLKPKHIPDHLWSPSFSWPPAFWEAGFLLCTQSYAIKCSGRLPNTFPPSGLCSFFQTSSLQTILSDYSGCILFILLLEFPRL